MFKHPEIRSKIAWLLVDLFVVFLGVYAAFALDNYRQIQQQLKRQETIINALHVEFSESQETLSQMLTQVNKVVDSLITEYESGTMPRLAFMQIEISHRSQYWETMMQMGGFDILDIEFVLEMEDYHAHVQTFYETSRKFEQLCAQLVLPNADADISEFYHIDTKKLKRRYAWYMSMLKNIKRKTTELDTRNNNLLKSIESKIQSTH